MTRTITITFSGGALLHGDSATFNTGFTINSRVPKEIKGNS
jgi:hypothetical protein